MGTIEISELLSYIVPPLILYNAWLHNQIIKAKLDIAVNAAKDDNVIKQLEELKTSLASLTKEFHDFIKGK